MTVDAIDEWDNPYDLPHRSPETQADDPYAGLVFPETSDDTDAEPAPLPHPVPLAEFLAQPDEPVRYRVDALWPSGGRVVIAARHKAGKTTLAGNLLRSLTDGPPFLGRFAVEPAARVTLVDDELHPGMLRRWLRDQGIVHPERAQVLTLRGRLSAFDIIRRDTRSRWAEALRGTDVLLLDCLRPALDALGLDENREAGRFLECLDELAAQAGITEHAVIHHMGHGAERSRGDSRILDWPDAVWNLLRDDAPDEDPGAAPRYFAAYGRDVDVPEDALSYDPTTRALTLTGAGGRTVGRRERSDTQARRRIVEYLDAHPGGATGRVLADEVTGGHDARFTANRDALVTAGAVLRVPRQARGGGFLFVPAPKVPKVPEGAQRAGSEPTQPPLYEGEVGSSVGTDTEGAPQSEDRAPSPRCRICGNPLDPGLYAADGFDTHPGCGGAR